MCLKKKLPLSLALCLILIIEVENSIPEKDSDENEYSAKWKAPVLETKKPSDFLISTSGCSIPNYIRSVRYIEPYNQGVTCDNRIVFITKTSEQEITFHIDYNAIKKKNARRLKCCYEFAVRSRKPGNEDSKLMFSRCKRFSHGDTIQQDEEIILVTCQLRSKKTNGTLIYSYEDAYLILKRQTVQSREEDKSEQWNVLLLEMDSMSRGRAEKSLSGVVHYLREHKWLDYKGYNKMGYDSFPNLMAVLTGKNASTIYKECAAGMENCKDLFIWNKYRNSGYMTIFGEDSTNSIFSPFPGFTFPPTFHYTRPYFLVNEYTRGNYECSRSKPSAARLLNYAKKFTEEYLNVSFFGFLRLSTISKEMHHLPHLSETMYYYFFEHLRVTGVLKNTFIFFFSDHGINFSWNKVNGPSYYDSRLPMLFIWVPHKFRKYYREEFHNLQINQHRLTTPHDVHMTLWKILKMSDISTDIVPSEVCPNCEGLFEDISPMRTCEDAGIAETWCTCHELIDTKNVIASRRSLEAAVNDVQRKVLSVKTNTCTKCELLELKTLVKSYWYIRGNKTYYVVGFTASPFDLTFESVVESSNNEFNVIHSYTITPYNNRSDCVVDKNSNDRGFCVCVQYC